MNLRPRPAAWFEALVPPTACARLLDRCARDGLVELQLELLELAAPAALHAALQDFEALRQRFGAYWPKPAEQPAAVGELAEQVGGALQHVRDWCAVAADEINELQRVEAERRELLLWRPVAAGVSGSALRFHHLVACGPLLGVRLAALPPDMPAPSGALSLRWREPAATLLVFAEEATAGLEGELRAAGVVAHPVPAWLKWHAEDELAAIDRRVAEVDRYAAQLRARLQTYDRDHQLAGSLAQLLRARWLIDNVPCDFGGGLIRLSGWTRLSDPAAFNQALSEARIPALVRFAEPPAALRVPVLLQHGPFVRMFEVFTRLFGIPDAREADPSALLALVVPLMFGYMFGDLGHGAVLVAAGLLLRRRWAAAALLVPCGGAAMAFGLFFGSVFGVEHWVPAMGFAPQAQPLLTLALPMVGGALLLLTGLLLAGLQAHWGRDRFALLRQLALAGAYLSLVVAYYTALGWWLLGACAGLAVWAGWRAGGGVVAAAGHFVEAYSQLLVNSLSFVRVGAFALAHHGLTATVLLLASMPDSALAQWLILVAGNLFVIALEGLVVAIQTTRLVLFEFFVRFMHGVGRAYRPLLAPAYSNGG